MTLKEIKKGYSILARKYKLPTFEKINEEFEIEKIGYESEIILKAVRKTMMEKVINSLGFLEMLLNPVNVPRMYVPYIRSMNADDKKDVDKIYDQLSFMSLLALDCEMDYSEKNEAELIKKVYSTWLLVKPSFKKIIGNMKKPNNDVVKKEKSYFG